MNIIETKRIKFGDFLVSERNIKIPPTIYYLHPKLLIIEPAFLIGGNPVPGKPEMIEIVALIVPKEMREMPLNQIDPTQIKQLRFTVDKNLSFCLVPTLPPVPYCTTKEELETWVKFT